MEQIMKVIPPHLIPVMKEVMMSEDPKNMMKIETREDGPVTRMSHNAEENIRFINNDWEMSDGDILLMSYPKTGTNWTMEILDRIVNQDEEELHKVKTIPLPTRLFEMTIPKKFQIWDSLGLQRRVFCTHLSADRLDVERLTKNNVKLIYVLRNPKDTLVSMYNFFKKLPPFQQEPLKSLLFNGWDNFYKHYMRGAFPVDGSNEGSYMDHILSWLKYRDDKNIHFVFYEDLKKDFNKEVNKLARHMEISLSEEKLAEIAEKCTITAMRKSYEGRTGIQAKHAAAFIHKGGVGGWKNYFTVAQSEEWDEIVEEKLNKTDIKFQFTI